ncbi:MAG: hypothetical protein KJP08_07585 [Gammaproteobacteria bacterium]|nr:hypothetical protein [Gammaproteobacteria bacterium]
MNSRSNKLALGIAVALATPSIALAEGFYATGHLGFSEQASDSSFTPYVKAGLGVTDNSYSARLGGAGVAAFDPFDGVTDGFKIDDVSANEFTLGIRIYF